MPRVIFRDGDGRPNIRLVLYPEPLPSSWHGIREAVPQYWDGDKDFFRLYRDPDEPPHFQVAGVLHMGMLDQPNEAFRLEKNSYKLGYDLPDVDGKYPDHDDLTGGGTWDGVPEKLSTDLDIYSIHEKVKSHVKVIMPFPYDLAFNADTNASYAQDANIVISYDHPRFLCGYEYYTSLAELYNRQEKRRAIFMHTPIEHGSQDIELGVNIAVKVAESMVEDLEHSSSLTSHSGSPK
ncbi:hypothetical protein NM208_g7478 [Fusarium decemcellulare]|uniref:Uncharacterized protein n=1 Tax=Fusarium decemcellulare TaxID=57161 RepID=A0ACC1S913_9HYPO|nr:hypothetical protein NM208_g7478 [Fusarium decemcellulare]